MYLIRTIFLLGIIGLLTACQDSTTPNNTATEQPAADNTAASNQTAAEQKKTILFFGNSLTAGLGVDPSEAFAGLIDQRLDSLNLPYEAINSGVSGETTAGGLSRVDWILDQYTIDIFVLELGGNDGLRGIDPAVSHKNLQGIVDKVKAKYPDAKILLAGMEAPPNMGQAYTSAFRKMYPALAKKNELALIPFLLDGVGGVPELNQKDGIHPTPEGHSIVAEVVWKTLKDLL